MRIIGILCWFDEPEAWLYDCVVTYAEEAGVDHVVALDGAYRLFPHDHHLSPQGQVEVIHRAAEKAGIGVSVYRPPRAYENNEIEKRTLSFQHAAEFSQAGTDWWVWMDADQKVVEAPDLKRELAATDLDAAEVRFVERTDLAKVLGGVNLDMGFEPEYMEYKTPVRCLYRADPSLHVRGSHYMYVNGRGQWMWAGYTGLPVEPAVQTNMVVEHRSSSRSPENVAVKQAYYRARFEHVAEDEFDEPEVRAWVHQHCDPEAGRSCPHCAEEFLSSLAVKE